MADLPTAPSATPCSSRLAPAFTVTFDANGPGTWYLYCHVLWHLAAGMATLVQHQ